MSDTVSDTGFEQSGFVEPLIAPAQEEAVSASDTVTDTVSDTERALGMAARAAVAGLDFAAPGIRYGTGATT